MYTFTLTYIYSYTLTHSFVYTQTQIPTQILTYKCIHIYTDTHSHAHMQPQPGYLSALCPPGPWGAHCLWEMAPEPPNVGLGRTRALPPGSPSPVLLHRELCCRGALGAALGSIQTGSPSAPCRGPHHRHETQATITDPTNFSPNLSQRRIPPVPGGFDHHGLMGSQREAHKKRHKLRTGSQ